MFSVHESPLLVQLMAAQWTIVHVFLALTCVKSLISKQNETKIKQFIRSY
jgi:hypothetical protein